jgi:hypothetical protein
MRRKDLTLHHGLVRADPVAAFGFTWSPEDADTDRWRIENVLESFVPRVSRVRAQDRQILRRMARLRKAKTKVRRWWLTRHIRADIKQRDRALRALIAKHQRWQMGLLGWQIRRDKRLIKLERTIRELQLSGVKIKKQARTLMRQKGTLKRASLRRTR